MFNAYFVLRRQTPLVLRDIAAVDSTLLTPALHAQIATMVRRKKQWCFLYRATRNGFGEDAFHAHCDAKGPTLSVARVAENNCLRTYRGHRAAATSTILRRSFLTTTSTPTVALPTE